MKILQKNLVSLKISQIVPDLFQSEVTRLYIEKFCPGILSVGNFCPLLMNVGGY